MESSTIEKHEEIIRKIDMLLVKRKDSESKLIQNISKLIDDKFNKNFLKSKSTKIQKLNDAIDSQLKEFMLKREISIIENTKKDIETILQHKKIKSLDIADQEAITNLKSMNRIGGLFDKILEALHNGSDISYMSMFSNVYVSHTLSDLSFKLEKINS
jgi:hypothetical protein